MLKLFQGTRRMQLWQPYRKEMRRPKHSCSISEKENKVTYEKKTLFLIHFLGTCRMQSWHLLENFHARRPKKLFQCLKLFIKNFYLLWKAINISKKLCIVKKLCWKGKMLPWQARRTILATKPVFFCSISEEDCFFFNNFF